VSFFCSLQYYNFRSSSSPVVVESPVSPTLSRPFIPSRRRPSDTPFSNKFSVPARRPVANPAGIQARQHRIAADERQKEYDLKVIQPVIGAVTLFQDKCVMCWMEREKDWDSHLCDNCPRKRGTNIGDPKYAVFRKDAFKLPNGWCFPCLIHQASFIFSISAGY
jgi:hypothetical protein